MSNPLFAVYRVLPNVKCSMTGKHGPGVQITDRDRKPFVVGLNQFLQLLKLELHKSERSTTDASAEAVSKAS